MSANGPRLLVFGRYGQVARALALRTQAWPLAPRFLGRSDADFSEPGALAQILEREPADLVVIAAAYTAVDRAESEPGLALRINAGAPGEIAHACAARNIPLIHLSTDYVFSGAPGRAWREDDPVAPINAYGRSKAEGERAVLEAYPGALILRTSWVFSPWGANFVKTILRLASERDEVAVVADQHGRPTSALDLADAILALAPAVVAGRATGLLHFANAGAASWADLAEAVFAEARALGRPAATVRRIGTADYPTPAQRPANSVLDTTRIERDFAVVPRPWREALADTVAAIPENIL